jgi:hypothetical protein
LGASGSLQETFAPNSTCFGCGPKNEKGLRVESRPDGEKVVADWMPEPHHLAFAEFASGGIISVLMDCNGNWAAAYFLMKKMGLSCPPGTVTAEYTVTFLKPTPIDKRWHLSAWVDKIDGNRVSVQGQLEVGGERTATMRGLFVAVGQDHPAFHRWQ